jgi:hypothetical protein
VKGVDLADPTYNLRDMYRAEVNYRTTALPTLGGLTLNIPDQAQQTQTKQLPAPLATTLSVRMAIYDVNKIFGGGGEGGGMQLLQPAS